MTAYYHLNKQYAVVKQGGGQVGSYTLGKGSEGAPTHFAVK